jgi:Cu-processing system permease protein
MSIYFGLASSLSLAFIIGAGIVTLIYQPDSTGFFLILSGVLLSLIFCSIAMLTSVYNRDKAKGIGASILTWLYFSLLFDGILVFLLFQFSDYPIEKAMMTLSMLNPIDLARILILLKLDVSALMGYTGALFRSFFGNASGQTISFLVLAIWFLLPFLISLRKFKHKDL